MTIGTSLVRAGSLLAIHRSPLPAARPHNNCGAHGLSRRSKVKAEVARPTHVPIIIGKWYNSLTV